MSQLTNDLHSVAIGPQHTASGFQNVALDIDDSRPVGKRDRVENEGDRRGSIVRFGKKSERDP